MVLLVSRSQSFLACHREVCWVLFSSSVIPVKCLSWWRTDYMTMLMTPLYWQLLASQQTDCCSLPYKRDLARIQNWFNHWCMILNHPHGDLVLSVVSICASPNVDIFGVKFDSRLTFEDHVRGIVSVSRKDLVFWGWWSVSLWIPLCCFVATISRRITKIISERRLPEITITEVALRTAIQHHYEIYGSHEVTQTLSDPGHWEKKCWITMCNKKFLLPTNYGANDDNTLKIGVRQQSDISNQNV